MSLMTLTSTITTIFTGPQPLMNIHQQVHHLADHELRLDRIDPVLYLYEIVKLGRGNSSARWMIDHGLTEKKVLRFIKEQVPVRSTLKPKRTLIEWVLRRKVPVRKSCEIYRTQAYGEMFGYLRGIAGNERAPFYVYYLFEAVVVSGSTHVELLFHTIGYTMVELRAELGIISIDSIIR